jgi:hypothetical protein
MIANKRETRLARLLRDQLRSDSANMNADHLLDETVIRVLDPKMVCRKCGHVGANVRSDWGPHVTSGTSSSRPLGVSERVLCLSMVANRAKRLVRPRSIQTQSTPQQQMPATSTWPSPPVDSLPLRAGLLLVPLSHSRPDKENVTNYRPE